MYNSVHLAFIKQQKSVTQYRSRYEAMLPAPEIYKIPALLNELYRQLVEVGRHRLVVTLFLH